MTLFDKMKTLRDISSQNYWAQRIYAELSYMSCLSSTKGGEFDERISVAADFILNKQAENAAVTREDTMEVEKIAGFLMSL